PQEGTMLTVLRAAAEAAVAQCAGPPKGGTDSSCLPVLRAATQAAETAETQTVDQLPALQEAGVTDAGGEGICVILRGLLEALTGTRQARPIHAAERPIVMSAGHDDGELG